MNRRGFWTGLCAGLGMMMLILDAKTALEGAQNGVSLCIQAIIPSLFPFFVLSIVFNGALAGEQLPGLTLFARLLNVPRNMEFLLIPAFLGGYPVGAQAVSAFYRQGQLSRQNAQRMLSFCSNAGPAFLFGMTASLFSDWRIVWCLWGIHIVSAVLTAMWIPGYPEPNSRPVKSETNSSWSEAVASAVTITASICGWVILFRILICFLDRWILWFFSAEVRVALTGLLELSNGCLALKDIPSESLRFLLCSVFLGCGGLCVTMQTASIIGSLSLRGYLLGKAMQTLFSLLLCLAIINGIGIPCLAALLVLSFVWTMRKKYSGNPRMLGV